MTRPWYILNMGVLEKESRRKRRVGQLQKALLTTAVVGGVMLIGGAPSPRALSQLLVELSGQKPRNKYRFKNQTSTALTRLAQRGYLVFETRRDKRYARITPLGIQALTLEQQRTSLQLAKQKRWDKRWRVIIFDIPESRRGTRDLLRRTMRSSGFYRLQDSVWLYPHDCEDFITLLKADLKLGNAVIYMIVERIENDRRVKDYFALK